MAAITNRDWMGVPGFDPSFAFDIREAVADCNAAKGLAAGRRVDSVLAGFDRERNTWEPALPVLFLVGGHVISVCNNKLDEVSVAVDQIDPSKGIADFMSTWEDWDGKWDMEWRECPLGIGSLEAVSDIVPCVEGETRLNRGWLNGAALVMGCRAIAVVNGIDCNLVYLIDDPVYEMHEEGLVLVCHLTGPPALQ